MERVCTWAIIQARMGSSRLPGKVMAPLCGRPVLGHVAERVGKARSIDGTIVATSLAERDDPIESFCREIGLECHRGSEEDVLDRYLSCADRVRADIVVRVTSDCPLIDPGLLDFVVGAYLARNGEFDYASNVLPPTFPDGLDVEVFSRDALERAGKEALDPGEREHVTLHFWRNAERFRLLNVRSAVDRSGFRWTLDTRADLEWLGEVFSALSADGRTAFGTEEVLSLLEGREDLMEWRVRGKRRQNSLDLDELAALLRGRDIPSVLYRPDRIERTEKQRRRHENS